MSGSLAGGSFPGPDVPRGDVPDIIASLPKPKGHPDFEEANREMKKSVDWHKVQPVPTPTVDDGSKKCKHCQKRIIWVNFGWRPRWMHSPSGASDISGFDTYEYCHMTAAEPEDEADGT